MKVIIAFVVAATLLFGVASVSAAPDVELSATYYPAEGKIEFISDGPWAGRDLAVHYTCEDDGNIVLERFNRLFKLSSQSGNWVPLTPSVAWDSCSGYVFEVTSDGGVPNPIVPISNTVTVTS